MAEITRRSFLKSATAFAGMPAIIPASVLGRNGKLPPSEKITVAGIGIGPRGREVLKSFLAREDVRFVAVADVQKERREIVRRIANRHYGDDGCATHRDMREVLGRADIDAVLIATGDHWHATASIYAARAGKDVYCEKPCTMSIVESRELDEEVRKHQRVYQAGTQRRNVDNFRFAVDLAKSGRLGTLHTVHAGIIPPRLPLEPLPAEPEPDPEEIDWNAWLGPAAARPYNKQYVQGRWRYHKGLAAGFGLPEWAAHTVDIAQWAAGADDTTPVEYEAAGTTIQAVYPNGVKLVMRPAGFDGEGDWLGLGTCPVRLEGEDGWVEVGDHGGIRVSDEALLADGKPGGMYGIDPSKHVAEFIECVKSRGRTACNSSVTRHGHVACHAAAISWKLGRKLRFDPKNEEFIDDAEADAMRDTPRREPWTI
ncbi:MAG: Gfo/Idh/MocA family oxidoreductase [Akkermansiaceae bacterium]|nr:Gfo/Idh/MocA family oxidoreductase [Akkermansiaceae bacterium]